MTRPRWASVGAALSLMVTGIASDAQTIPGVNVYPAVPLLAASNKYTVRVCAAAANPVVWNSVFTFQSAVPANPLTTFGYYDSLKGWSHSYVNFEMTVPVTVEISKVGGQPIISATVRPARKASNVYVTGGKVYLTMNNPCNIAVDIDGQMESRYTGDGVSSPIHTISIHGNPVLADKPIFGGPDVLMVEPGTVPPETFTQKTLYFKPGVHDLGIDFQIYPDKQYYIPGDAIVYATFNNYSTGNGNNIRIFGHGTLSGGRFLHWKAIDGTGATSHQQRPIDIQNGRNIRLEGITIADSANNSVLTGSWVPEASVTNVVTWIKIYTWRVNGDGGGAGANNEVTNCFMRTQDDGIYIGGRRVSDNVLWTDAHGSSMRGSFLPNLASGTFMVDNNDIIYARNNYWSGSSPLSLGGESGNSGEGVVFSNLNFSDPFPNGSAIQIHQGTSGAFAGARFENITITDVRKNSLIAKVGGAIHDLTFNNLVIGGVLVTPSNWLNYFTVSGNVYNISFTSSGSTPPDALPRTNWVASASTSGGGSAASAIDGNPSSRWSTGLTQSNGQWFRVDMGSSQTFSRIVMNAGSSINDYPRSYQVHVSQDGLAWGSPVATGTGSNAILTVTFPTQKARYIRVTQTGSSSTFWWGISDFHAYIPVELPSSNWLATASLSHAADPATNAFDKKPHTRWSTGTPQTSGVTFQVDMLSVQTFDRIVLDAGYSTTDYPRGYQVHVSTNGVNWGSSVASGAGSAVTTISFPLQTARYIRVTQTGSDPNSWWGISDFRVNTINYPTTYTLGKNISNGTTVLDPAWPTYPAGTVVKVTAVPTAGHVFNNWTGILSGTANPTTITMNGNNSLSASIAASTATCTLTETSPNGEVTFNPLGPTYPINTVVTVTAVPTAGYVFNNWTEDLSGSASPTTILMNANKNITASIHYPPLSRTGWVATATPSADSPNAFDGHIDTRWSTGASQTNGQWYQVDMGAAKTFNHIALNAGSSTNDYPRGYQAHLSNDGVNWGSPVASGVGSAVTHITFPTQTARYIRVTQTGSAPGIWWSLHEFNVYGPVFPSPWQSVDINTVAASGSASYSIPTWTIAGSGADMWGTADAFRYVYQSSTGDCSNEAKVLTLQNTGAWARSGVMIRETTSASSTYAMICVTPGNGVAFQRRSTTGGSTNISTVAGLAPKWLRINRTGNLFKGFWSDNGINWTQVGPTQTITMAPNATIGMVVSSYANGILCTSTMDSVTPTP